ncbi:MAG: hypothetical protein OEZ04_05385 [Nitrospinota bacterium]|nr:hypothetical protein [Nitrospinota bacterium]
MATEELLEETKTSLKRIQDFDSSTLARTDDLGKELNFEATVPVAEKLVSFYKRIPGSILDDLPDGLLNSIKGHADADYSRFKKILDFSSRETNAADIHQRCIDQINLAYDESFKILWHYVAYGVSRVTDTATLENEARATIQQIRDEAQSVVHEMNSRDKESKEILENIKKVAAEQGVSQQSFHFNAESTSHETEANSWYKYVLGSAALVGVFAILSIFLHKLPWIAPTTTIEASQLISSKILIFIVLGYLLLLSVRNYLAHKHNAVVNKHRQNALITYQALVDAASERTTGDIVLAHAAACIFTPQETGYTKSGADSQNAPKSTLEILTKASEGK